MYVVRNRRQSGKLTHWIAVGYNSIIDEKYVKFNIYTKCYVKRVLNQLTFFGFSELFWKENHRCCIIKL